MVQVYSEPLCRRHHCAWFSEALLLRVLLPLIAIAVSLVVSFATGGFWVKIKPAQSQPEVHFTYDAIFMFQSDNPNYEAMWTTSPSVNTQFSNNLAAVTMQAGEYDSNFDGKPDVIRVTARVAGPYQVYGVTALLQFNYSFSSNIKLQTYGLAYLTYSSSVPGGALYADGDLSLRQLSPITDRKFNGVFNVPVLNSSAPAFVTAVQPQGTLDLSKILTSYMNRNYTTVYSNVQPVWQASAGTEFTLTMVIRIPPNQVVWYRPQIIEMLKWGWIQFLATYVVLWWLFWWLQWFAFRYRIVTTHVVSDVQPKTQRF